MEDNWLNLEHKALVQESEHLKRGIRAGIRTFCGSLYSKELLPEDLYHPSSNEDEDILVQKVLLALQDRVKGDAPAFGKIVQVLKETMSFNYLATNLQDKLVKLREEHTKTLELQAEKDRELQQRHELVMQQQKRNRPSSITPTFGTISSLRSAHIMDPRTNTEPANMSRDKHPQAMFQMQGASSLSTEIHTGMLGSPYTTQEGLKSQQRRISGQAQLEIGLDKMKFFPHTQEQPLLPPDVKPALQPNNPIAGDFNSMLRGEGSTAAMEGLSAKLGNTHITPNHTPVGAKGHTPGAEQRNSSGVENSYTAGRSHSGISHTPTMNDLTLPAISKSAPSMAGHTPLASDPTPSTAGGEANVTAGHLPPAEYKSVPETYNAESEGQPQYLHYKNGMLHDAPSHSHSTEQFTTAPTSPRSGSPASEGSNESCSLCYEMRLTISKLRLDYDALALEKHKLLTGSNEIIAQEQVVGLRQELHQSELEKVENKMKYDRRHKELQEIISELRTRIKELSETNENLKSIAEKGYENSAKVEELKRALSNERRERERERLAKEREIINVKEERLNTQREMEDKEEERRQKELWVKYCEGLWAELQEARWQLLHRANSLHCNTDGNYVEQNYPSQGDNYYPEYYREHYPPQGEHYPPQGEHYSPQGEHYPPQGEHYSPQGEHYSPQGEYYPPQGEHYPPQKDNVDEGSLRERNTQIQPDLSNSQPPPEQMQSNTTQDPPSHKHSQPPPSNPTHPQAPSNPTHPQAPSNPTHSQAPAHPQAPSNSAHSQAPSNHTYPQALYTPNPGYSQAPSNPATNPTDSLLNHTYKPS